MFRSSCHCEPVRTLVWQSVPFREGSLHISLPNEDFGFRPICFSGTVPSFDLLFSGNSGVRIIGMFIIHQLMDVVAGSETGRINFMSVFVHTPDKIVGNANVNCRIRYIREYIDVIIHFILKIGKRRSGLPHQSADWFAMTACGKLLRLSNISHYSTPLRYRPRVQAPGSKGVGSI